MYVLHTALPMTALDHVNSLQEFLAGHCLSRHHLVDVVSQPVITWLFCGASLVEADLHTLTAL